MFSDASQFNILSLELWQIVYPSKSFLVQRQQWKHQKNVWHMFYLFKDNKKSKKQRQKYRTISFTTFWRLHVNLNRFHTFLNVSILNLNYVNGDRGFLLKKRNLANCCLDCNQYLATVLKMYFNFRMFISY